MDHDNKRVSECGKDDDNRKRLAAASREDGKILTNI